MGWCGGNLLVYTYLWDNVIAEDFFSQFNRNDLLASEESPPLPLDGSGKDGSMPANDLVRRFLRRPQALDAFKGWRKSGISRYAHPWNAIRQIGKKQAGACHPGLARVVSQETPCCDPRFPICEDP